MVKKLLFAAAGLGVVLGLFFGRDAASYVGTSVGWIKDSVRDSVPIEFQLERARKMVKDLVPDIRNAMHVIAREEVEVAKLERQITEAEQTLGEDREHVERLAGDLRGASTTFVYAGRTYTAAQVTRDLKARFERYKTKEATLASLREMHQARLTSLDAARNKLEGMQTNKRQLEVDLQNLDAQLKMVEAAQTTCEYNFDDSRLARAKELVGELRTRLEVEQKLVDAEGSAVGEIPLDEPAPEDVVAAVESYFHGPSEEQIARLEDHTAE